MGHAQSDLVGKSIYNIIAVEDHAQFSNILKPMSTRGLYPYSSLILAYGVCSQPFNADVKGEFNRFKIELVCDDGFISLLCIYL